MVEDHAHGMLKIFKLLGINILDLTVQNLLILNQREQDVSGQSLALKVQPLRHLALLQ
jgi:hypothetical protein